MVFRSPGSFNSGVKRKRTPLPMDLPLDDDDDDDDDFAEISVRHSQPLSK